MCEHGLWQLNALVSDFALLAEAVLEKKKDTELYCQEPVLKGH